MHSASTLTIPRGIRPPLRPQQRRPAHLSPAEHGLLPRSALIQRGLTDAAIRTAVRRGRLQRVARGWYALPHAPAAAVQAIRAGYRLTCLDALSLHGLWIPPRLTDRLHVHHHRATPHPPAWALTHGGARPGWTEPDPVASVPLALAHAIRCLDGESAAVLLESAMARGVMTPCGVEDLLDAAPARWARRLVTLSSASESGSETRVVRWLRARGFAVEQQVFVDGVGFVDACVAGVLLEIDGRGHHSSPDSFARDRRRDLALRRRGLQVLRLSYEQVWTQWPDTQRAVLETIDQVGRQGRRAMERLAG